MTERHDYLATRRFCAQAQAAEAQQSRLIAAAEAGTAEGADEISAGRPA